ncbi:MAG: hypothetical protein R6V12_03235 [Candidatus Hydrogenedentota bacterium]
MIGSSIAGCAVDRKKYECTALSGEALLVMLISIKLRACSSPFWYYDMSHEKKNDQETPQIPENPAAYNGFSRCDVAARQPH